MIARGNEDEIQGVCSWKKGHPLQHKAARSVQPQVTIARWIQVSARRCFCQKEFSPDACSCPFAALSHLSAQVVKWLGLKLLRQRSLH